VKGTERGVLEGGGRDGSVNKLSTSNGDAQSKQQGDAMVDLSLVDSDIEQSSIKSRYEMCWILLIAFLVIYYRFKGGKGPNKLFLTKLMVATMKDRGI
jgi:hypothetical protein